jgi:UDP-N-acetyl-D-glucosamine dehydrogenase
MHLRDKIADQSAVVGVLALGYVGLPLLRAFWNAGFRVIGFDIDAAKIAQLRRGENYLRHLGEDFVADMISDGGRCEVTDDFARLADADAILVCVPTPLGRHLEPDLSYVARTADDIARTLRPGQLIVLESTTYPGTTREIMLPPLQARGLTLGEDFFLAYSPEREDPGRKDHNTQTIPKLVGGCDAISGELAAALYRHAIRQVIPVRSAEVAEAAKILENVYRAVNIALVNELKLILAAMDIDVWEVIDAAATKPFGFQAFYPGPGLGGHCIPIDPFYLTWKAREVGQPTRFIELAGQVNHRMPAWVVERVQLALNARRLAVRGSRILVLGLAYKPDVDDVRESPSFELIRQLRELGADVDYHDPHVPKTHPMRHYPDLPPMTSIAWTEKAVAAYDCVLIATHHAWYDWAKIGRMAKLIVDTRGVMRHIESPAAAVVQA